MGTVIVKSLSGYQQEILTTTHRVVADEPREAGGDDAGPNPYELLLGALGSCKAMTVLMYGRRKGWDVQAVEVALTHRRDYATDCEECAEKPMQIARITARLTLTGNLDEEQRQRLKEIAGRCPVHRTLAGRVEITDE